MKAELLNDEAVLSENNCRKPANDRGRWLLSSFHKNMESTVREDLLSYSLTYAMKVGRVHRLCLK